MVEDLFSLLDTVTCLFRLDFTEKVVLGIFRISGVEELLLGSLVLVLRLIVGVASLTFKDSQHQFVLLLHELLLDRVQIGSLIDDLVHLLHLLQHFVVNSLANFHLFYVLGCHDGWLGASSGFL